MLKNALFISPRSACLSVVVLAGLVAGCAGSQPSNTITALPTSAPPQLAIKVSAAGEEKAKLEAAVATVDALLASQELWDDFAAVAAEYPQIFVGPEYQQSGLPTGMTDPAGALALLRNSDGRFHVFESVLALTGTYYNKGDDYVGTCTNPSGAGIPCRGTAIRQNYSNELVVTHGIGLNLPSGRELVSIEIGRGIFNRYNASSTTRKSCTYNTLAHEWTHTIGKNQNSHWTIVVDEAPSPSAPIISYLLGSVVQCSWLKRQGGIGTQGIHLKECVRRFGVNQFNSLQCT